MHIQEIVKLLVEQHLLVSAPDNLPVIKINAISTDSRQVQPGNIFVAIPGTQHDGHTFIQEALNKGAQAVISEYTLELPVPLLQVVNSRQAVALLSAHWWGYPSQKLLCSGITGTNGKTTTAFILNAILEKAGYSTGLMGSILTKIQDHVYPSTMTTPDAPTLQHLLHHMVEEEVEAVTLEVSSHGILQDRCFGISFAAGILTNISPDHHDLHPTLDHYIQTKLAFFQLVAPTGLRAVNGDDPLIQKAITSVNLPNLVYFGLTKSCHLQAVGLQVQPSKSIFTLAWNSLPQIDGAICPPGQVPVTLNIPGKHNVYNALGAATAALFLGIPPEIIVEALATFTGVARRLQLVHEGNIRIIDDFAHNPASIRTAIEACLLLDSQHIIIVNAIRGNRGLTINRENAATLASYYRLRPQNISLIITSSQEIVGKHDLVSPAEAEAFLTTLEDTQTPFTYYPQLNTALKSSLSKVKKGDLILLLGAQGMEQGAEQIQKLLLDTPEIVTFDPYDELSVEPTIINLPTYLNQRHTD